MPVASGHRSLASGSIMRRDVVGGVQVGRLEFEALV